MNNIKFVLKLIRTLKSYCPIWVRRALRAQRFRCYIYVCVRSWRFYSSSNYVVITYHSIWIFFFVYLVIFFNVLYYRLAFGFWLEFDIDFSWFWRVYLYPDDKQNRFLLGNEVNSPQLDVEKAIHFLEMPSKRTETQWKFYDAKFNNGFKNIELWRVGFRKLPDLKLALLNRSNV